jgi:hypothetical protein
MMSPTGVLLVRGPDIWASGGGAFGASRSQGDRIYQHQGADLMVPPWRQIYAPADCLVKRIGIAYAGEFRFHSLLLRWQDPVGELEMKILYVWPTVNVGDHLRARIRCGVAEDLNVRYPDITNHVHVEVRRDGMLIDPLPMLEAA